MRTIIAGSRNFTDYYSLSVAMDKLPWRPTVVLSGGARGTDAMGELWAKNNGIPVEVFTANWLKYGRSAGPRRNEEMGRAAEALVALPSSESVGTRHMILFAKRIGLRIQVFEVRDGKAQVI